MKQFVIAGTLAGALAVGGTAFAQTPPAAPAPKTTPAPKAEAKPADQAEKPAAKPRVRRAPAGDNSQAGHAAPKAQPNTTAEPEAPGAMALGTVRLPKGVKLDGKTIAAGSYQVRLTADEAKVETLKGGDYVRVWINKGGNYYLVHLPNS